MLPRLATRVSFGALLALLLMAGVALPAGAELPPPPPPPPSSCQETGQGAICRYALPLSGAFVQPVAGCGDLSVVFTVQRDFTVFYDASGALLRQIRHAEFTGTITAVGTGRSVPYEGRFTQIYDYRAGTRSVSGDMARATLPDGRVVFAAGHEVDAGPDDLLFLTPHATFTDGIFAQVCQGLQ